MSAPHLSAHRHAGPAKGQTAARGSSLRGERPRCVLPWAGLPAERYNPGRNLKSQGTSTADPPQQESDVGGHWGMRVTGELCPSEKDAGTSLSGTAARERLAQRWTNPPGSRGPPAEHDTRPSRGAQTPEQGATRGRGLFFTGCAQPSPSGKQQGSKQPQQHHSGAGGPYGCLLGSRWVVRGASELCEAV